MEPMWIVSQSDNDEKLPSWHHADERELHRGPILDFRTRPCSDFQAGYCPKHGSKGKKTICQAYHFETQRRRVPVDVLTSRIMYWDVACPHWNPELGLCTHGDSCMFAHGRDEISYHPAKYKTQMCNGSDCRGAGVCCFAHGEEDLRPQALQRYSYLALVPPGKRSVGAISGDVRVRHGEASRKVVPRNVSDKQKIRFCASYPSVAQCRRGAACGFAHARDEICTPLLTEEEEQLSGDCLSTDFFAEKFKTLWCPIGAQHDWQTCAYAHTYQDARRKPSIGYGMKPCPFWSKENTRLSYQQRCPLGIRCPNTHGAKELLYHPAYYRTFPCRTKNCPRQHLCAFYHKKSEIRPRPKFDEVDNTVPLGNDDFPKEWAEHFLSPPFFKDGAVSTGPSLPVPVPSRKELTGSQNPQKVAYTEVEGWMACTNTSAGESDVTDVEDVSSASSDPQTLPEPLKVLITPSMTRWHQSFLQGNRNPELCHTR